MSWNLNNDKPIYAQIVERIQRQIISGFYKAGDKLPSVRDFAADAGVNPNTMQKAFVELERSGLIVTVRTSGRTVTEDEGLILAVKTEIEKEQVQDFLLKMKEFGFSSKEILDLLNALLKEERE